MRVNQLSPTCFQPTSTNNHLALFTPYLFLRRQAKNAVHRKRRAQHPHLQQTIQHEQKLAEGTSVDFWGWPIAQYHRIFSWPGKRDRLIFCMPSPKTRKSWAPSNGDRSNATFSCAQTMPTQMWHCGIPKRVSGIRDMSSF